MPEEITRDNLNFVRNRVFRDYAAMYLDISDGFISQVEQFGLPFKIDPEAKGRTEKLIDELEQCPDIIVRNDRASLVYKRISPACEACKNGVDTITSHISFNCHRRCFFCFNPNQDNYEAHLDNKNDWRAELEHIHRTGGNLTHIALTGGEPLLYPDDCLEFFKCAKELFPDAHLRLYTSGDLLTKPYLVKLKKAGLDELRFSYKMEDTKTVQKKVLNRMQTAVGIIPSVMVEMPVMPDCENEMQELLVKLDEIGIFGINLLELCFPYNNAPAFSARGFALRFPPYRTLYNFWYAGGLPVAGSEEVALRLMKFAVEKELNLGIHYCSLENKNFGQMYQQNKVLATPDTSLMFSQKDYYLKTVKAFGEDADAVKKLLDKRGVTDYVYNRRADFIQFHPRYAKLLTGRRVELALSVNVQEYRDGEVVTKELKLLRADVKELDPEKL